jgi:tetratricopeptide (TPR) repeat protein
MAGDINKNLDRAKRFLEKNRVEDAIAAYLAVLEGAPQHQEATQALGDLYSRTDQPDLAAVYYGLLFDMLIDPRDENKAVAIYNRFLRSGRVEQPPERIARYAFLQQKQNHAEEAIDQYTKAAEMFTVASRDEDALFCLERIAQLDPENPARQLRLAEAAERISRRALAARAYLRAGQLATAHGEHEDSLKLLQRAYVLAPQERSVALLYAEAKLRAGMATEAVTILDPFAGKESDATFVDAFGKALVRAGQLDRARGILEGLLREKNVGTTPLFELADAYAAAGQERNAVDVLLTLKRRMFADKKQNEFAMQMDLAGEKNAQSQAVLEFWAALYNELNRESKYFEIMTKLFDVYVGAGNISKAAETLEKLVDIDPYDSRNQERLERLRNRVDDSLFKRIAVRLARSTSLSAGTPASLQHSDAGEIVSASQTNSEAGREKQTLEDLIVQTEIFLQYSLHNKALDRLQKIGVMFPGEEKRNARLSNLYQLANWWPPGAHRQQPAAGLAGTGAGTAPPAPIVMAPAPQAESQGAGGAGKTGVYTAETLRDLSKISEVNQKIFRQQTPRAMLNTAVNEVGSYLHATRSLAVVGPAGRAPELTAEFCATEVKPATTAQVVLLLALMEKAEPD